MNHPEQNFVHLHVHTMYSLLDGAIRLKDLVERARADGMEAVAITDHGTMFGVAEFFIEAKAAGIKPIIGCECYVAPRSLRDKTPRDAKDVSHLVLLARDRHGYRNLCKLATIAQLEGFYYRPRIDKEVLARYSRGLIGLSACLHGEIPRHIVAGRMDLAEKTARFYQELFGEDNFFLEVQNNGLEVQETVNLALRELGRKCSIGLVASNDCHYLFREHARAHDVLLCVQTGKTVHDQDRFKFRTDQLYFKSQQEMIRDFSQYPGAVENTAWIAGRCNVDFDFKSYHFPKFQDASGLSAEDLFVRKVRQGFEKRWDQIVRRRPEADRELYIKRLDYEIEVINSMGFPGYFLIVADFIQYARQQNVPVGPGRGSAAGSLVAYSLGITELDPIEHGLIFERFLNPSRISMPDIDVDFCINGREKVFKYVVERYGGGDYVAQIITFGKLKPRAVIRDVGRALGFTYDEVDVIAKLVPEGPRIKNLDQALELEPKLRELVATRPEIRELIDICRTLEGLPRHASTHAAGVVIGDKPLVEYLPLYRGKKGEVVTQWDMKLVEKIGLVKFDFLGLRNLTVIDHTLELVRQQGKTSPDLADLDFNDKATYRLLAAGDTTGVFQLESSGMKDLLVRMKPERFDDLIALVALYRPGPLESGMVSDFVDRKHGRKPITYMFSELEPILEETYGVIVYQEQVMKIAGALADYSMAEADGLRKAMGKKIASMMAEHRQRFVDGAARKGVDAKKAAELFDLIEKFGGYGFNKSHSAAYAVIAFQTAYLKAHFPVEFMAALLTSEMQTIDGVVKYINECRNHDIEVLPPDINSSGKTFTVTGGKIRFGLAAVKNVGLAAIDAIISERESGGRFESLFDFCQRVDLHKVNKRVVESLIACGAFDSTGQYRSRLMAVLEDALEWGQSVQRERNDCQMCLFDTGDDRSGLLNPPVIPNLEQWSEKQRLDAEKEYLGFYVSGHPLERHKKMLEKFTTDQLDGLKDLENGKTVRVGGMITSCKMILTKKKERMAFVTLEDMAGSVEVVVFPSVFAAVENLLIQDAAVLVQGRLQKEEKGVKVIAAEMVAIDEADRRWTARIHIQFDAGNTGRDELVELKSLLAAFPGDCQCYIHIRTGPDAEVVVDISDSCRVQPSEALIREVTRLLGSDAVSTECLAATAAGNGKKRYAARA